jgi:hypothetical protein
LAHREAIAFNIKMQVPESEASQEWFSMKADEQFVRKLKEEAEKKRK